MELEDVGAAARCEALCRRALQVAPDFAAARVLLSRALEALDLAPLAFDELVRAAAPDAAALRYSNCAYAVGRLRYRRAACQPRGQVWCEKRPAARSRATGYIIKRRALHRVHDQAATGETRQNLALLGCESCGIRPRD